MEWTPILFPSMGEGVHEATIVKWLKNPAQAIVEGEPLVEVSTDKVDTEIVAEQSGYLIATYANPGETINVGQLIGCLGKTASSKAPSSDELASFSAPKAGQKAARAQAPQPQAKHAKADHVRQGALPAAQAMPTSFSGFVRITPLARNLAKQLGVSEIGRIGGSGQGGRITRQDILEHYDQHAGSPLPVSTNSEAAFNPLSELFSQEVEEKDGKEFLQGVEVKREKMSKIRKLTAEHMLRSVRVSPHVTTTFEMNLSKLSDYKKTLGSRFEKEQGVRLTYTVFFIAFAARCLEQYPHVNASVDREDILLRQQINVGCAVAVDTELVVPVIRNAASKGIVELAKDLDNLSKAARNRKLAPSDIVGGSFTITNPGMYGSLHSQPIINQPQVAILSVGSIVKRPWADAHDKIGIAPLCQIGLTFDHRIIDGRMGAMFLKTFEEMVLNPESIPL